MLKNFSHSEEMINFYIMKIDKYQVLPYTELLTNKTPDVMFQIEPEGSVSFLTSDSPSFPYQYFYQCGHKCAGRQTLL